MSKPVVAITRPEDRAKKACDIVEKLGGEPFLAPTLDLEPVNSKSLKDLIKRKDELDWIIFTSPTTIVSLNKFYPDFLGSLNCKLAVIGNKTGKLAEENGLKVDLIPEDFTAEGLIEEFKERKITNQIIGIPRTLSARPVLPEELEKMGNTVILAEAYKSLFPMDKKAVKELISKIENKEIDAITFTSPLTVENFFKIIENKEKIAKLLSDNILTVCIGPITAKVLKKYNITYIHPDTYTVPDMMELLFKKWREQNE
ncbi:MULTISPECIES: uroporphyrinogen-III synthase [Methanobrevibacter]|uniref:Uroporphyrinogen-III synthase n=1 Tax=Methanobrevibacter gottschalkii DSM 11977 TaxID=1122229 RepID=A0A3N5BWQ5_9EURY|nr:MULTISPECIES: uroporphyrinogen-III synthase [Methanobrevibacter]OEC97995.1 uroporphyrinogen-III synthase [Methanobrevibacter sp. A27]RPF51732.1 uroporphyrinogen-III synthase [Methanobrevibacter gottschalkii DSM 11977]